MKEHISTGKEQYVWPDAKGNMRGAAITPLYKTVPVAVVADEMLYRLLAIAGTFRIGRTREVEIAKAELRNILSSYDNTRCVSNQLGYVFQNEHQSFRRDAVIDI